MVRRTLQLTILSAFMLFAFGATNAFAWTSPSLTCVTVNTNNSVTAHWGYANANKVSESFAIGSRNEFDGAKADLGQPTVFKPGTFTDVFSTTFTTASQTWTLNGHVLTATKTSTACKTPPPPCPKACTELPEVPAHLWLFGGLLLGGIGYGATRRRRQTQD